MIGMAHNFLQQAVHEPPFKPAASAAKISRVLLKDGRVSKITEEPRRNLICEGSPEALPVTFGALAECRKLIISLAQSGLCGASTMVTGSNAVFANRRNFPPGVSGEAYIRSVVLKRGTMPRVRCDCSSASACFSRGTLLSEGACGNGLSPSFKLRTSKKASTLALDCRTCAGAEQVRATVSSSAPCPAKLQRFRILLRSPGKIMPLR